LEKVVLCLLVIETQLLHRKHMKQKIYCTKVNAPIMRQTKKFIHTHTQIMVLILRR